MDGWVLEAFGWVGSALLVWSLMQTGLRRLRVANLIGCLILIVYNALVGVWPMFGLNVVLAAVNIYHLVKMARERHKPEAYEVLEVAGDDTYLRYVLRVNEADILKFNPHFVHDPFVGDPAYLILKGEATVGVVVLRDAGDGRAQLLLDYVTPAHRDLAPGEFVLGASGPLRRRGFERIIAPADMVDPYYEQLGLTHDGDTYVLPR